MRGYTSAPDSLHAALGVALRLSPPRCQVNHLAHHGRVANHAGRRSRDTQVHPRLAFPADHSSSVPRVWSPPRCQADHLAPYRTSSSTLPAVAPATVGYTRAWRSLHTTRRAFLAFGRHHAVKLTISRTTGRARPPCRRSLPAIRWYTLAWCSLHT